MRVRLLGAAVAVLAACSALAVIIANPATTATGPCGTKTSTSYTHVVVVVMENKLYSNIIGSSSAPYENSLAQQCGLATNYYGVTHPSLPNYIALAAGTTAGITDDKSPAYHRLTNPSIFSQVGSSSWRSYQESMPFNCDLSNSGSYAVKHNPAAYFTNIRTACGQNDVPLPSTPSFSRKYTFVTPNLCHDMHDCSVSTGDAWLKSFVPKILASTEYRNGNLVLFLTFDESNSSSSNHVATIVVGPTVPAGTRVSTSFNHYSLLRTAESILGVPCLSNACNASSMRSGFHL